MSDPLSSTEAISIDVKSFSGLGMALKDKQITEKEGNNTIRKLITEAISVSPEKKGNLLDEQIGSAQAPDLLKMIAERVREEKFRFGFGYLPLSNNEIVESGSSLIESFFVELPRAKNQSKQVHYYFSFGFQYNSGRSVTPRLDSNREIIESSMKLDYFIDSLDQAIRNRDIPTTQLENVKMSLVRAISSGSISNLPW